MSSSSSPPIKDYKSAITALYSPLHQSTTPETINAASARRTNTIHDMNTYLYRIGLDLNNRSNNNNCPSPRQHQHYIPPLIIHITGTKGKGSTLSYCESLLRHVYKLHTGMFTSPHLVSITERIRINGKPISCEVFGKVYWTVRELLEMNCHQHFVMLSNKHNDHDDGNNNENELPPLPILPGYFRMLTLMAIYTFCYIDEPKVDVILLEVGMGGRYDATNIFESNNNNNNRVLVQGITLIDYDHTRILGSTLEQIAWEKGGIFVSNKICNVGRDDGGYTKFLTEHYHHHQEQEKEDSNASNINNINNSNSILFVNGNNTPQVSNVLRTIAHKENGRLQLINNHNNDNNNTTDSTLFFSLSKLLQFHAKYQYDNAALALSICQYAMKQYCYNNNSKSKRMMICPTTNEAAVKQQLDREDGTYYDENVIAMALNNTFWPGRCHTLIVPSASSSATGGTGGKDEKEVVESTIKLRCDGAHTPISINACIHWFQSIIKSYDDKEEDGAAKEGLLKVLIFNCGHERNPIPLLYSLNRSRLFDCVYFCRADFERPSALPKKLLDEWLTEPLLLNDGQQSDEKDGDVALTYQAMCNEVAKVVQRDDDDDDIMNKKSITWQETLANIWRIMDLYHYSQLAAERKKSSLPTSDEEDNNIDDDKRKVLVGLKVADAIRQIQNEHQHAAQEDHDNSDSVVEILVTGSLYLVGSALEAVGWEETESEGVLLHSYD